MPRFVPQLCLTSQFLASVHLGGDRKWLKQVLGSLPPMWETRMGFPALAVAGLLGVNQRWKMPAPPLFSAFQIKHWFLKRRKLSREPCYSMQMWSSCISFIVLGHWQCSQSFKHFDLVGRALCTRLLPIGKRKWCRKSVKGKEAPRASSDWCFLFLN